MKTVMSIIIIMTMLFTSCGSNQSNEKSHPANDPEQSVKTGDQDEIKNCDDYLSKYEEWSDNYLKLVDKYMKNPMDPKLMQEFMTLSQEGSSWMDQWNDKLLYCASKEKYQKRFDEISEKTDKKLEELGEMYE